MTKAVPIRDLFHVPSRFVRSVQLERDFNDPHALENYIVTPAMAQAFQRLAEGLQQGSGRRAWRITGDYGVGKSSFALVLAHLLSNPSEPKAARIAAAMGWSPEGLKADSLWPVLVTGAREGLVTALARGIAAALRSQKLARTKLSRATSGLITRAQAIETIGTAQEIESLVLALCELAQANGAGLLLIVDEMGKLLEHAADQAGREDIFVLQRIAEVAARSGDRPFLFVGLLHQGFQAYADRLPTTVRHEWDKVAGRFEEIVFDQPLAHTAALVGGALGVDTARLPKTLIRSAKTAAEATASMGWLSGATSSAKTLDAAPLYPLHPTVLPPLVRFFARYGQHERSLFGFLLSSEPFGLQAFAEQPADPGVWYGLADFYDYVRAVFGHRLSGASYQSHWLRIVATVDTALELDALALRMLKTVALLNLLDADDLMPTDGALRACFAPVAARDVDEAVRTLVDRGLLFRRGVSGGYRLWPNSSVNLNAALEAAAREIGPLASASPHLEAFLERAPILARRHYVERGTMRFFEVRYAQADQILAAAKTPTAADGLVVIALADSPQERQAALDIAAMPDFAERDDVIVGVLKPLACLAGEVHDLKCWQWVADNTPELAHDVYAAEEVTRQLSVARRDLGRSLASLSGLRQRAGDEVVWHHRGVRHPMLTGLSSGLSDLCDALFAKAPRVTNELINRNMLSSPASAARMRLIEGLFNGGAEPFVGIDPVKAPPEKSMYLSVIQKGGVHVPAGDGYEVVLPSADADVLNLSPALDEILQTLEAGLGARVAVSDIFARLKTKPFGVRDGLSPLLLAIVLKTRGHEIAVYENGTFKPAFGAQDFMRLIKAPATFELQHCRLEGVRAEVFTRLAAIFAHPDQARPAELLDVVQALCRFAAQLPEYARKAGALDRQTATVRDVLMSAREPATMLFTDLPIACGLEPFVIGEVMDDGRVNRFVEALETAIATLRWAYPSLLARIVAAVADATGFAGKRFDRAKLASRAARVSLAARQPRLRTFALRLRDPGKTDEEWAEALASFVISKAPERWGSGDEANCLDEVVALAELFDRVESAAFKHSEIQADATAVRVSLTRGDGRDLSQIVHADPLDPKHERALSELSDQLPNGKALRVQFLMQLLWRELDLKTPQGTEDATASKTQESDVG